MSNHESEVDERPNRPKHALHVTIVTPEEQHGDKKKNTAVSGLRSKERTPIHERSRTSSVSYDIPHQGIPGNVLLLLGSISFGLTLVGFLLGNILIAGLNFVTTSPSEESASGDHIDAAFTKLWKHTLLIGITLALFSCVISVGGTVCLNLLVARAYGTTILHHTTVSWNPPPPTRTQTV